MSGTVGKLPQGAKILEVDPNGKWVKFEVGGKKKVQFDVNAADHIGPKPLAPTAPGRVPTPGTKASVGTDGKVYVTEGMHRLEAAQGGAQIAPGDGGIPGLPGWLEFDLWEPP